MCFGKLLNFFAGSAWHVTESFLSYPSSLSLIHLKLPLLFLYIFWGALKLSDNDDAANKAEADAVAVRWGWAMFKMPFNTTTPFFTAYV